MTTWNLMNIMNSVHIPKNNNPYLYLSLTMDKPDSNPNAPYINYSALRIFDKTAETCTDIDSPNDVLYTGITVDANYIYIAIEDENRIKVINKHTKNDSGSINVQGVKQIIKEGDFLYAYSSTHQRIVKFEVSFN